MSESTQPLTQLLDTLSREAKRRDWTDTEWAGRAGVRKETLSRVRRRRSCDLATLNALAGAVGHRVDVIAGPSQGTTADGHLPEGLDREYEERLVELCASGSLAVDAWSSSGPGFFMAGLAVMLASVPGYDRQGLLALAEELHPGASEPAVFTHWLERSPLRPTRFLAQLGERDQHAA